jgi:type I restriction enzyme M protein
MITGEIRSRVDRIWDTMWAGGISNPLTVVEQLTYLLFIKRLDELHTLRERKANRLNRPIEDPVFSPDQDDLRWSRFKETAPETMFDTVREKVFPFIKTLGAKGDADGEGGSTYTHHMKDALFMMPTPRVLANVVDQLDGIDMADTDTKGDLYEYMLGKIASAGQNGQFRTPRHIIKLMVDMTAPTPKDVICDPACGTAGFLIAASEYLVEHHSDAIYRNEEARRRFNEGTFHGYDFDSTMLRIGSMNMLLHGVENPDIRYRDSLAEADDDEAGKYTLILANPPFAGSLDYESTAKDLQQIVKTKKTELLFLALFLRLLQTGGRAAVIVPDGVLFGSSKAHKKLRKALVEEQKLDAIVSMPSGVFKPYAGVSTAILFFTKTESGGTDNVWFYDMQADGFSLDDKRTPQPDKNDLPDVLARWRKMNAEQGARNAERRTGNRERGTRSGELGVRNAEVGTGNAEAGTGNAERGAGSAERGAGNAERGSRNGERGSEGAEVGAGNGERERKRTEKSFCVPKSEIRDNDYDLSINRYKEVEYEPVQYDPPAIILERIAQLDADIANGRKKLGEMLG